MHAEPRHHIRCILFDLGNTLWQHSDRATWAVLEDVILAEWASSSSSQLSI